MDEMIAFEQVVVAMKSANEMLLAFMDGAPPGKPGAHRCVALLTCSREVAEALVKSVSSALNEK